MDQKHHPNGVDIEDFEQLRDYLRVEGHIAPGEEAAMRLLTGGVSNRVVLVQRAGGEAWVLKQALEKLRVQVDWFSSPERIHREALGLRWLERLAPAGSITPLVFEDVPHHILAMRAVPEPHENWKSMLLAGRISTAHIEQFAALLGTVHRNAAEQAATLAALFDDTSFFESLRLEPYYTFSAEQAPAAGPFLRSLLTDTRARRLTLVHGDYSPKNILVREDRLILLDHEVVHWGDPAFDAGFALTHLLSKAHHLPAHRNVFARAAMRFWEVYTQALGAPSWAADLEPIAVRHTLACLLARAVGRSPLEYLDPAERARQRDAALALMLEPPGRIAELTEQFIGRIDRCQS